MRQFLVLALLVQSGWAEPHTDKMVQLARQEWEYFGKQTIGADGKISHTGHREAEDGYSDRVGVYWRDGVYLALTGKDTDEPWSAAFMSWVMRESGLGNRFRYSEWHAHYINEAIEARRQGDDSRAFWGYRLDEVSPRVGDLVCYSRQDGISFDRRPDTFASHTDLVVAVRPGQVDVIGGNVQDSVTLKTLSTDPQGRLVDKNQRWFAIMRNRLAP